MIYDTIAERCPIEKGWSGDRKYCAVTTDGRRYLLRITDPDRAERLHLCFLRMQEAAALGIPMCMPIEFGQGPEGTYVLHSWIDGSDAEAVIPELPARQQYAYGLDAGRILKKLHSLPAPDGIPGWAERFNAKIDRKIAMYESCPLKYENGALLMNYLIKNRDLLQDRPQTYQHGDYHIGNMMVDSRGKLTVIDFDRDDFGDPWEEFNRIVWCAQSAPAFAGGMVDGYFDGNVPVAFWKLLALYICCNSLGSLPWAIPFGEKEIGVMRRQAAQVLEWYDGMRCVVPGWYHQISDSEKEVCI